MKITLTVGISGSGKSTWAHEEWEKDPYGTVLVERDKIRELLFGYTEDDVHAYYDRKDMDKLEKEVTMYENTLIREAISSDKHIIVANTHLDLKYINRYAYFNKQIELKFFDIDVEEAIRRVECRTRYVQDDVIKKQYEKYKAIVERYKNNPELFKLNPVKFINDPNKPSCYIFDIDGTLAERTNRGPFDWHLVGQDKLVPSVAQLLYFIPEDLPVMICSGRDAICIEETKKWLLDNHIFYTKLYMRSEKDNRPDYEVKEEMWRDIAKDYYIMGMFDDRAQVVDRARYLGLKVFQVEYNNF